MDNRACHLPPKWASNLLSWATPATLREHLLGDLDEEFLQRCLQSPHQAQAWYISQALRSTLQFIKKTKRGLIMLLLSVLFFVAVSVMGMMLGIEVAAYFDVPSILLVVAPAVLFAIAATSFNSFKLGFSLLLNDEAQVPEAALRGAQQMFTVMGNSALLLGGFTTLMGAIAIGSNVGAEEFASVFGPAVAVCLLTLYYGFAMKILCYVAQQKLQFKLSGLSPNT
ncbi:permease prefix domain 2-containing transporter [Aliiglaciecola sp. CAU 1673]|uniref:permease prefix domain 2-containing transporter n=1 Tax=Aliiglaciecola sp. CAU 1673 TaxID=3032595 RepID=UPI0023DA0118|nr:permease prefix domain 2-containing transporter [Aliiglaciecola sp. CAU 1673]MDF2178483.1 permease prefix domain 2-containing transporter [Aliiglaciecola sp. CAU 1673]